MPTYTPTKEDLVVLFREGAERKAAEHEKFLGLTMLHPEKEKLYHELFDYVDIDRRYYEMASHYYESDYGFFEDGKFDDLILLTQASELPPSLYAAYLRELDQKSRFAEKVTHAYILRLKALIRQTRKDIDDIRAGRH